MAYEDEDEGSTSPTNYGLAYNPLMPMGDPLAYARTTGAQEPMVPRVNVPGAQPQQIYRPPPVNVPEIPRTGGGASPEGGTQNQLQPQQDQTGLGQGQLGSLGQLLQMKGLMDVAQPSATTTTTTTPSSSDVPAGGSPSGPHPRNVSAVNAGPYTDEVNAAADKYGNDRKLFTHMMYRESGFNPNAVSSAGAVGLGQFMPQTAKDMGIDPKDPHQSIDAASKYLAQMRQRYNGNDQLALMGYNWGPGNVDKWLKSGADINKVPKETRDHVLDITGRPIGPNMGSQANAPSASAAPMAFTVGGQGGQFALPGGTQVAGPGAGSAPGFGVQPKKGDMSPHGGPYITGADGKLYGTDKDGNVVGGPVVDIAPDLKFDPNKRDVETSTTAKPAPAPSQTPPAKAEPGTQPITGVPYTGTRPPPAVLSPGGGAGGPPPAAATPPPQQTQTQTTTPAMNNIFNDPSMEKLWKFMLIKSLFPQIQFRNIGYDPWAVHRFGQGGGY